MEERVYQEEGVVVESIEFVDNQPVLDLIEKKPVGILPLLDEETIMPKGTGEF